MKVVMNTAAATSGITTAIIWFRRDLRVHDNPALQAALDAADQVVPVFIFDDSLLHGRHASGNRTRFLLECLKDLDESLTRAGGRLFIRHGNPAAELKRLAKETGATELHFAQDVSPFSRDRGKAVAQIAESTDLTLHGHPGLGVIDDLDHPRTGAGNPYSVFSPYYRKWLNAGRRGVLRAPRKVSVPSGLTRGKVPSIGALKLTATATNAQTGGETAARKQMERWIKHGVSDYKQRHNDLGADGTSRLSAYLHFGCVSPRELESKLPEGVGASSYRRQLCWRDFYHHVLLHFPDNATKEYRAKYRDLQWRTSQSDLKAWQEGRTGFPLVDAAMRQLVKEGYMHNRARLVVGSFLTKDLGIDWRKGERFFMEHLIDGDEANNNGNWQWIASVGVDPQPAYRRIYNPARHRQKYDPEGAYVRKYLPELERVPAKHLDEPAGMSEDEQRKSGCMIGSDYPEPIVDHQAARQEALERYRV